jgi:transcriptional regulator with XRE-family HTH domain
MTSKELKRFRKRMNKTQKQIAQLLGISLKAIKSYEQGWRNIPAHVERQMFFLIANKRGKSEVRKPCWVIKKCPPKKKKECPAWEFKAGELCWLINGTICDGTVHKNWKAKMKFCRSCEVLKMVKKL